VSSQRRIRESGMHQEAIEVFGEALSIQSDDAQAHNNVALACGKSGKHRQAIAAFKEAIRAKPDYAEAHYNLAITYLILKDENAALREYSVLKNLDQKLANQLFELIHT
jgi:tetratricopeptide (TPR) repeat protein